MQTFLWVGGLVVGLILLVRALSSGSKSKSKGLTLQQVVMGTTDIPLKIFAKRYNQEFLVLTIRPTSKPNSHYMELLFSPEHPDYQKLGSLEVGNILSFDQVKLVKGCDKEWPSSYMRLH